MLEARYLANLSDDLIELYAQLEYEIKRDIFKRLNKLKAVTDATTFQTEILIQTGSLKNDINELVKKYDVKAQKELLKLFDEALEKSTKADLRYFAQAQRELSENQSQIIKTTINRLLEPEKTNKTYAAQSIKPEFKAIYESLTRMTSTVADVSCNTFIKEANNAYMKVTSGAYSWQSAFRSAVNSISKNGVKVRLSTGQTIDSATTVGYTGSGSTRLYSIESATRMNILTGINQTASQQTLENCDNLNTDLVEVDAHIGARPEHEALQGKVYCLTGERDYIDGNGVTRHAPNFYETCKIGTPTGICGINCRHSFYPYFEGTPLLYSNGELSEMADKRVTLDNKKITPYDAEQQLRLCERNIRQYKSEVMGYEITKQTDDNPAYIAAKENIYKWQKQAQHITNETGIKRKYVNEYIGTKDGQQPRGKKPTSKE